MVKSIVIGFALYLAFQTLTLGLIGIYGLFNPDIMNLLNTTDIVNIDDFNYNADVLDNAIKEVKAKEETKK